MAPRSHAVALDPRERPTPRPAHYIAGRFADGFWIILCPLFALALMRPDFAGAWKGLGVISKWRGDLGAAVPLFRKAAALDPNYSDAWCSLAGALATLGQTGEALALLERYRERHPEDPVAADLERAIRSATAGSAPPS